MPDDHDSSRRRAAAGLAAGAIVAWSTPSIVGFDRVGAATGSVGAPTVRGDGILDELTAGDSLRPNSVAYSSNSAFFVFPEACQTLATGQVTDAGMTLPAGVQISAYLVHFSPAAGATRVIGGVDFPGAILGYDWTDASLVASDAAWGVSGVNYGTTRRRLEYPPGNDQLTVTAPGTIDLNWWADAAYVDQLRVYVAT